MLARPQLLQQAFSLVSPYLPCVCQMMSNMMQQMSAEDIAAMGERMGAPMSVEQAEQARKFMSSLPPERLATMVRE